MEIVGNNENKISSLTLTQKRQIFTNNHLLKFSLNFSRSALLNQLTCTCSKSTIETRERKKQKTKTLEDVIEVVLVFLLLTLNIFPAFFLYFNC